MSQRSDYRHFVSMGTRFRDNDMYGHVNNSVQYELFDTAVNTHLHEQARVDFGEATDIGVVKETRCEFASSVAFPALVDVGLAVEHLGSSSVVYRIGVFERSSSAACAVGKFVHVYVDRVSRKPSRIPSHVRSALLPLVVEQEVPLASPLAVPHKMLGAILYDTNAARPYAHSKPLKLERINVPTPREGEVLVKIEYSSLCHSDLSVVNGNRIRPLPMLLGHEAAGRLVSTGKSCVLVFVPSCRQCPPCLKGRLHLCSRAAAANGSGDLITGPSQLQNERLEPVKTHLGVSGFAEYVCVAKESVVEIPNSIPLNIAAIFGCAALTGMGAVLNSVTVNAADSVCIMGLGAVGIFAVLAARTRGASVYAVDPVASKRSLIANWLPASHVFDPANIQGPDAGFDYIIECSGSPKVLETSVDILARGGALVCVGLPHPDADFKTKALNFAGKGLRIIGSYMGDCHPSDLVTYLEMWQSGELDKLELLIDEVPLNQINESLDALHEGKVVRRLFRAPDKSTSKL